MNQLEADWWQIMTNLWSWQNEMIECGPWGKKKLPFLASIPRSSAMVDGMVGTFRSRFSYTMGKSKLEICAESPINDVWDGWIQFPPIKIQKKKLEYMISMSQME